MNIEEVYDQHVDKVYKFFYIKSFDKSLAEDLTSQTFMALVERLQDDDIIIQDGKKFVYGIMRNVWLMYLREKYRRNEMSLEGIEDFENYVDEETVEYEAMTVKERAEPFISRLPEKQQEIVRMRLLEDRSIKEICSEMDKDSNYVKTTYKRGVKRLQEIIRTDGIQQVTLSKEAV